MMAGMLEPGGAGRLCVSFRVSLREYVHAVRQLAVRLRWVQIFVAVIITVLVGGFAFALGGSVPLGTAFFAVGALYAGLLFWIVGVRPRRQYHRISDLSGDQTYCFSDDEVSWTFASGASHVKWSYFTGLIETKEMFLLRHPTRSLFSFVPKRAFKSPDDEARFRELARQIRTGSRPRVVPKG